MVGFINDEWDENKRYLKLSTADSGLDGDEVSMRPEGSGLCLMINGYDGMCRLTKDEAIVLAAELTAWANKSNVL